MNLISGRMFLCFATATFLLQEVVEIHSEDPCISKNTVTLNQDWRNINQPYNGTSGLPRCDSQLYKRWYRFTNNGGDDMPVNPPRRGYCETSDPVWLNGALPTVSEQEVNRSVCVATIYSYCDFSWVIQVKNCSGYYVYELISTPGCAQAYCIGTKQRCSAGELSGTGFEPCHKNQSTPRFNGKAKLTVEVHNTNCTPRGCLQFPVDIYQFNCTAPPVYDSENDNITQPIVLYRYEWTMRGIYVTEPVVVTQNFHYITEHVLEAAFTGQILGTNLACRVSVTYKGLDGYYSDFVETSTFLGIQILTPSISLIKPEKESAYVQLKSSIPVLCQEMKTSPCYLSLQTLIPKPPTGDPLKCQEGTDYLDDVVFQSKMSTDPESCFITFPSASWTDVVNVKVSTSSTNGYKGHRETSWNLRLQVVDQPIAQPLWRNYTIGEIPIFVRDNSTPKNAMCIAYDDPHMVTFDQTNYEMQQTGEYVMYRHATLPIAVHAYFVSGHNPYYSSVCGFAVQSGSDLIVNDNCNTKGVKRIKAYGCSDNGLHEYMDGNYHEITLPTGTKITLDRRFNQLTITATSLDFNQTMGLCGTYDGNGSNDFKPYNGPTSEFANGWKILDNKTESLYFGETLRNFESWKRREEHYCVCRKNNEAHCAYTSQVDPRYCAQYSKISKDPNYSACLEYKKRSTESTDDVEFEEPTEFPEGFNTTLDIDITWKNNWTEINATKFCENYITSIPQYEACSAFKDVDVQSRIDTCVLDIQLSGGTEFSAIHKGIMLDVCENIYRSNQSLWTTNNETGEVELPSILSTLCPSDCSGHGICNNGSCVCEADYTDSDCSGNLTHVPVLFPLPTGGLCDTRQRACLSTTVFADQFTDTSSCLLQEFVMTETDGKISTSFTSTTSAKFYHDQKVACTLPTIQSILTGNTLGYGFKVSVANTANAYSTPKDLVVYDSNCVSCSSDQVCQSKNGACVIEAVCYKDQDLKPGSNCLICDSSINKWDWTTVENGCIHSTSSPTSSTTENKKSSSPSTTARNLLLNTLPAFLWTITIRHYY